MRLQSSSASSRCRLTGKPGGELLEHFMRAPVPGNAPGRKSSHVASPSGSKGIAVGNADVPPCG